MGKLANAVNIYVFHDKATIIGNAVQLPSTQMSIKYYIITIFTLKFHINIDTYQKFDITRLISDHS